MRKAPSGRASKRGKGSKNDRKRPSKQAHSGGKGRSGKEKRPYHVKRESLNRKGILLWGLHAVREALLNSKRTCFRLWMTDAAFAALEDTLLEVSKRQLRLPENLMISKADLEHFLPPGCVHQGMAMEVDDLHDYTLDDLLGRDDCPDILVVLDQVTDPHNVGAIMRSAAAFGVGAIIVTERGAPSVNGLIAKTACGAAEHVPLIPVKNLARSLEALQRENFWCVGLAEEGKEDICDARVESGRVAIVLGAEGTGLRQNTRKHCNMLARLPTQPPIGSLNVSNAAAVALYETRRQRS